MEADHMRQLGPLLLLLLVTGIAPAQKSIGPTQRGSEIDAGHKKWIDSVLRSILPIKPGGTRKDLLKVFTEEGGLSTRTQRTYVYRHCPYIKVDVQFAAVGNDDGSAEMREDRIVAISRPYLDYSTMD
jgi:hypothetical protein